MKISLKNLCKNKIIIITKQKRFTNIFLGLGLEIPWVGLGIHKWFIFIPDPAWKRRGWEDKKDNTRDNRRRTGEEEKMGRRGLEEEKRSKRRGGKIRCSDRVGVISSLGRGQQGGTGELRGLLLCSLDMSRRMNKQTNKVNCCCHDPKLTNHHSRN